MDEHLERAKAAKANLEAALTDFRAYAKMMHSATDEQVLRSDWQRD